MRSSKKNNRINKLIKDIRTSVGFIEGQQLRIKTLKKVCEVLKENKIECWLSYGTLIGCLRHGGMIPWDDDIDISMNRKDYDLLFSINWEEYNIKIEKRFEANEVLYEISSTYTSNNGEELKVDNSYIDLFIVPVGLKSDEGGYYRHKEELMEEEIYPLVSAKFEGSNFLIPNNPYAFFERRYFNTDVLNYCSIWNRETNNLYEKGFSALRYIIHKDDLNYSMWGTLNGNYWKDFYKKKKLTFKNSEFSNFVLDFISKREDIKTILDIGCGNGRDSEYFSDYYKVTGIDLNIPTKESKVDYIQKSIIDIDDCYDVYYSRFLVHSISEIELDIMLKNIINKMSSNSLLFIETRSIKGIGEGDKLQANFKSSIGDTHFRILYSMDYLKNKLISIGFSIDYEIEDNDLAIYKDENPYIIRLVCKI